MLSCVGWFVMIFFSKGAGKRWKLWEAFYFPELWVTISLAIPTGFKTVAVPLLWETTGVQGEDIYDSISNSLALLSFPVPTIEVFSASPLVPKTSSVATTTAVFTVKGQADPTIAGADPRDGRDPFEDRRSLGTVQPTIPELPPTPRRFCEATRRRAIDWPQTHTGSTVERPCPKGTRGRPTFSWFLTHTDGFSSCK